MIDDLELERRLRVTFDEVIPRLIDRAGADRHDRPADLLDTRPRRRQRRSWRTFAVAAGAAAVLAGGTLALSARDTGSRIQGPVTDPSVVAPPETLPDDSSVPVSAPAPTTAIDEPVDLSGEGTGLHLPDGVLPDGWTAIYVGEWVTGGGGSAINDLLWTTLAAQYSADRTRIEGAIEVSVFDGEREEHLGTGTSTVAVRGVDAVVGVGSLAWFEEGRTIDLRTGAESSIDLVAVAEGLIASADGSMAFGVLPDGFEVAAVFPGLIQEGGPIHYTKYATEQSVDPDRDLVLTVQIHPTPQLSAEAEFVQRAGASAINDRYATQMNGRRVIVDPGYVVALSWDEADGSRVDLEYGPFEGELTSQERVDRALGFAAAIRRADQAEWNQLVAAAPDHLAAVQSRTFIADALAERGLVGDGYPRNVPVVTSHRFGLVVPVATADGVAAGACEFLLRQLVGCTDPEALSELDPTALQSRRLDDGYIRILVGSAIAQLDVHSTVRGAGGSVGPPTPLVLDSPSPGIVLVPERAPADTYCLTPLDADGNTIQAHLITLGPAVIELCES